MDIMPLNFDDLQTDCEQKGYMESCVSLLQRCTDFINTKSTISIVDDVISNTAIISLLESYKNTFPNPVLAWITCSILRYWMFREVIRRFRLQRGRVPVCKGDKAFRKWKDRELKSGELIKFIANKLNRLLTAAAPRIDLTFLRPLPKQQAGSKKSLFVSSLKNDHITKMFRRRRTKERSVESGAPLRGFYLRAKFVQAPPPGAVPKPTFHSLQSTNLSISLYPSKQERGRGSHYAGGRFMQSPSLRDIPRPSEEWLSCTPYVPCTEVNCRQLLKSSECLSVAPVFQSRPSDELLRPPTTVTLPKPPAEWMLANRVYYEDMSNKLKVMLKITT